MRDNIRTDGGSSTEGYKTGSGVVLTNYFVGFTAILLAISLLNILLDSAVTLTSADLLYSQRIQLSKMLLIAPLVVLAVFNIARRLSPWPDMSRIDMQVLVWVPLAELTVLAAFQILVVLLTASTFVENSLLTAVTAEQMLTIFAPIAAGTGIVALGFYQIMRTYLDAGMDIGRVSSE